jgi:hypothetical protein
MIDDRPSNDGVDYDPASMATSSLISRKAIWYKRPWVLITFAVVVIVGVSVITDLPHPISKAEDAAAQNATIREINRDIKQCTFALDEAFRFYRSEVAGKLSAPQLKVVNTYLISDQTVCSFAGPSMSELNSNVQVVETAAGRYIDKMLNVSVLTWMDSDANGAIADIKYLFRHPGDAKTLKDLSSREHFLANDRLVALDDIARASAILGLPLHTLNLPQVANLPGS